jgi:hypothetical protein
MRVGFKHHSKGLIFNICIFSTLLLAGMTSQIYIHLNNQKNNGTLIDARSKTFISQGLGNDTIAPVITFIEPENNNTIIRIKPYTITANISDENPPVFGNVTIQISNLTSSLFNASMNLNGGNQWSFTWDNITSYPNRFYRGYIINIIAVDSSPDYNLGMSGDFYIYLNIPGDSPGAINIFFYLIIVCLLFAGIVVYLNRKILRKVTGKDAEDDKGVYEY